MQMKFVALNEINTDTLRYFAVQSEHLEICNVFDNCKGSTMPNIKAPLVYLQAAKC